MQEKARWLGLVSLCIRLFILLVHISFLTVSLFLLSDVSLFTLISYSFLLHPFVLPFSLVSCLLYVFF
jgi:hypothetical protein